MKSKPTLYLLPGLLCDATVWQHQHDNLTDLVDIHIANFRGMDALSTMAQSVIDQAPEQFLLAGHSMGGRVAMQIVDAVPERVNKLALLDTAVQPVAEGEAERRQGFIEIAEKRGMHALAVAWGTPMVHPDRQADMQFMNRIYAMVGRYSIDEFKGQVKALLKRPGAAPFLKKAPAETIVICGREDLWSPWQQHMEFAKLIPTEPEVIILENCGHMSTMELPTTVTEKMRQWLKRS